MWKAVKSATGENKVESIQQLVINGTITKDNKTMANALNDHFIEKVKKLVANMPPQETDILKEL